MERDAVACYVSATVIHRVRINERRGIGEIACGGGRFSLDHQVDFCRLLLEKFGAEDLGYDPNGVYSEGYAEWFNDRFGTNPKTGQLVGTRLRTLCFHCQDREPAWRRWRRKRQRQLESSK